MNKRPWWRVEPDTTWRPEGGEIVVSSGLIEIDELTGGIDDAFPRIAAVAAAIAVRGHITSAEIGVVLSEVQRVAPLNAFDVELMPLPVQDDTETNLVDTSDQGDDSESL